MSLKNIIITSSINSLPTLSYGQKTYTPSDDYQSFPIETIIGGNGGVMPDLHGNISSSNLFINIIQSWSGSINTPAGIVNFVDSTQNEFINGQFSGSDLLVSNGNLSEDNPFLKSNLISNYYVTTYYYDLGPFASNPGFFDPINVPLSNYLNINTEPKDGEIYLLYSFKSIWGGFRITSAKIAVNDINGNNKTTALQQLTNFRIQYTNGYIVTFNVINTVFYGSYYLFELSPNLDYVYASVGTDQKVLDYDISASNLSSLSVGSFSFITASFTNIVTNPLGYLDSTTGVYTPNNTPNVKLYFTASLTQSNTSNVTVGIYEYPSYNVVTTKFYNTGINNITFTGSFTPVEGTSYVLVINNPGTNKNITNIQFSISPSPGVSIISGTPLLTVFSPDFNQDFFYNEWNALYGNADGLEYDKNFMKAIYETGQSIPSNQEQILSGSAERAPVKPYNYALKAQTLPRYEGVRSTSPDFNQNSISGGYGTLPNVESTRTVFAYCDYIGSWIPEHMEASNAHVKYLIDTNENVIIPNTSQYSLYINQDAFISREKISISSGDNGSILYPYRNIIRGASRIEPILYTQKSFSPIAFTSSINLYNGLAFGNTTDVTRKSFLRPLNTSQPPNTPANTFIGQIIPSCWIEVIGTPGGAGGGCDGFNLYYDPAQTSTSSFSNPGSFLYNIIPTIVNEATDLIVKSSFEIYNPWTTSTVCDIYLNTGQRQIKKSTVVLPYQFATIEFEEYLLCGVDFKIYDTMNFEISNVGTPQCYLQNELWLTTKSYFNVFQNPLPNPLPPISASIWNFPTSASWNQQSSSDAGIIYIPNTASLLNVYYGVPGIRQDDISGSGFNPIVLDWSIKTGDEFRYIGREDKVFEVKKVYSPDDNSTERISSTGSLEVHFTSNIPIGSFSLNEFLIRRYTDDPSAILFEGFKPPNSSGPYVVKPEFIDRILDQKIDKIITDLTQKGLL